MDKYNKKCLGECRHRTYRYGSSSICEIIGDYMDGSYKCPKYDPNYRYCEKYDTYCRKTDICKECKREQTETEVELVFGKMLEDNRNDNGGYNRKCH